MWALVALAPCGRLEAQEKTPLQEEAASDDGTGPYRIERGEGELPLLVPRDEELVYEVHVAWGVLGAAVGTVTLTSGCQPYRAPLLANGTESEAGAETAWIKARAYGKHLLYTMDATLEAHHQPQEWPRLVYRSTQEGTERRRRELLFGVLEGKPTASYRRDTTTGAPRGTRIWKEPEFREIPPDALDMTSAVYLVRTFVLRGLSRTSISVLEKKTLWSIRLSLGETLVQETPAGRFEAVEVLLHASHHPFDAHAEDEEAFEGLFGLRGSMHLWVERYTGIPVRIQGEVPAGPLMLDVDIVLKSHRGAPPGFRALPAQKQ